MNTYYHYSKESGHVRYFYDRSIRLWTYYPVSAPNDEGDQTGDAEYLGAKPSKSQLEEITFFDHAEF